MSTPSDDDTLATGRVIKAGELDSHTIRPAETERAARRPRRISAGEAGEASPDQQHQPSRILRGPQARTLSEAYEIPELEASPVHPLGEADKTAPRKSPPAPTWEERLAEERACWEAEQEEKLEMARREGYEAGYREAREELENALEEQRQAFARDAEHYLETWQAFIDEREPLLVELAVELAEGILKAPLPKEFHALSSEALRQALDELASEPPITIRLHPVDFLRLQEEGLTELIGTAHPSVEWNSDPKLKEGDWIAESTHKTIRHLRSELAQVIKRRLGLQELSPDGAESNSSTR